MTQLEQTKQCLFCDGYNYKCKYYVSILEYIRKPDNMCPYYKALENDLEKFRKGEQHLTFGELEKILKKVRK